MSTKLQVEARCYFKIVIRVDSNVKWHVNSFKQIDINKIMGFDVAQWGNVYRKLNRVGQ